MKLVIKSPVWDDLKEIGLKIAADNPLASERWLSAARQAFEQLRIHPHLGRVRSFSIAGIRSWLVPGFPNYVIFYLPTKAEIQILAVLHGARDLSTVMASRV